MAAAAADDGDTSRVIGERSAWMVGGVAGCVKKVKAFDLACHHFLSLGSWEGWLAGVVVGLASPSATSQLVFVTVVVYAIFWSNPPLLSAHFTRSKEWNRRRGFCK